MLFETLHASTVRANEGGEKEKTTPHVGEKEGP